MEHNAILPIFPVKFRGRVYTDGLSKREYFAGLAMQSLIASEQNEWDSELLANVALKYADALLLELEKEVTE